MKHLGRCFTSFAQLNTERNLSSAFFSQFCSSRTQDRVDPELSQIVDDVYIFSGQLNESKHSCPEMTFKTFFLPNVRVVEKWGWLTGLRS